LLVGITKSDLLRNSALSIRDLKYRGLASATDFAMIRRLQLKMIRIILSFLDIDLIFFASKTLDDVTSVDISLFFAKSRPYCNNAVSRVLGDSTSLGALLQKLLEGLIPLPEAIEATKAGKRIHERLIIKPRKYIPFISLLIIEWCCCCWV
jgi:hypothetical protein